MQVKYSDPPLASSIPTPSTRQPLTPPISQPWHTVPLHWLDHCQRVDTQFAGFHIQFDSAIAIRPSNPRFQIADLPIALMPPGSGQHLKATIGASVKKIEIWLVGSAAVTVSALDQTGHCLAMAQTQAGQTNADNTHLLAQRITLETAIATTLRVTSKLPFMMTRVALAYA